MICSNCGCVLVRVIANNRIGKPNFCSKNCYIEYRTKKWLENASIQQKCWREVAIAISNGYLIPQPCKICGGLKSEAHHEDYSKPLEVIWFCKRHHRMHHLGLTDMKLRQII